MSEPRPCPECGAPVLHVLTADNRALVVDAEGRRDGGHFFVTQEANKLRAYAVGWPDAVLHRAHVCPNRRAK